MLSFSLMFLSGCLKDQIAEKFPDLPQKLPSSSAEGFDYLGGSWEVGAIYYEGHLIDIHDHETIEGLYDTIFLSFMEDGTFSYYDIFFSEGEYVKYEDKNFPENTFLLKTTRSYRYVFEGEEFVEEDFPSDSNVIYILEPLDENTFSLSEFDPVMGAPVVNYEPYIFVRNGEKSAYISENKTVF